MTETKPATDKELAQLRELCSEYTVWDFSTADVKSLIARIDAERARADLLEIAIRSAFKDLDDVPELNMSNYTDEDASALNEAGIRAHAALRIALRFAALKEPANG